MTSLRNMDQRLHLDDPARKQTYVTVMFDEIAPRYDAFTRWFSYGMDVVWKQELVRGITRTLTRQAGGRRGLDLACGTGDLARALAAGIPDLSIEGIDISPVMISRAEAHPQVTFRVGDATRLEAASGSVQLVTIGYGLRNFPDHRAALREIHRALAPHGVVGILEFTKPGFAPWRWLLLGYLWVAGMIFGWWWHRHGPVYGYIAHSIARFTTRKELVDDLAAAGFDLVSEKSHLGGGIAILIARKRS